MGRHWLVGLVSLSLRYLPFVFFFFNVYFFLREREGEHEWWREGEREGGGKRERQRQRKGGRKSQAGPMLSRQSPSWAVRSGPEPKSRVGRLTD